MEVNSHVEDASPSQDAASKSEADMIKQLKAKDEMIQFLRTSVEYWRDRALSGGSEGGAHDLKLLQKNMEVDSHVEDASPSQDAASKSEADMIKQLKAK